MALDFIRTLLGTCPAGYESIEYIFAGIMFFIVLKALLSFFYMIAGVFR